MGHALPGPGIEGLNRKDQFRFLTVVMNNSPLPPPGKWRTAQIAYGAILTAYTGLPPQVMAGDILDPPPYVIAREPWSYYDHPKIDNYINYFFQNGPFIPFGLARRGVAWEETNYPEDFYVIRPGWKPGDRFTWPSDPYKTGRGGAGSPDPDAYKVSPPPSFWPPAFFGTQAVLADRYTAARVLRLALATDMWKPVEPLVVAGESGWAPPPFFFWPSLSSVAKGSPGARPFDPSHPEATRASPATSQQTGTSGTAPSSSTDPTSDDAVDVGLAIGAALAPALPDHFGALASAGFSLADYFTSSTDGSAAEMEQAVEQMLQQVTTGIDNYISVFDYIKNRSALKSFTDCLGTRLQVMKNMAGNASAIPGWYGWLERNSQSGGGGLLDVAEDIWNVHVADKWEVGALDGWAAAQSMVLHCLKLMCQTDAVYEAQARSAGDLQGMFDQRERWYGLYELFATEIRKKAQMARRWINDQIDDRLCRVGVGYWSDTFHVMDRSLVGESFEGRVIAEGWAGKNEVPDPVAVTVISRISMDSPAPPPMDAAAMEILDETHRRYRDYVAGSIDGSQRGLAAWLDWSFAGVAEVIATWESQLQAWADMVPPRAPRKAPRVNTESEPAPPLARRQDALAAGRDSLVRLLPREGQ